MDPEHVGRFRIEAVIGRGGSGVVYRAVDEHDGTEVALKVIPAELVERRALRRLHREAAALARVRHPAIAGLRGIEEADGRPVLVLEYVAGENLRRHLAAAPLASAELLAIAQDIAEGLAAAHAAGILHRDLKAENVVIGPDGRAVILDFGFAKLFDPDRRRESTLTATGERPGTLCTMSPEQVRGAPCDHRSDLFALGVLMYEMATGNHPFRDTTPPAVVHRICFYEAPAVTGPGLDGAAAALIHHLMAKQAARRPRDAAEVAIEIARLRGAPPIDPPPARPSKTLRLPPGGGIRARLQALIRRATMDWW